MVEKLSHCLLPAKAGTTKPGFDKIRITVWFVALPKMDKYFRGLIDLLAAITTRSGRCFMSQIFARYIVNLYQICKPIHSMREHPNCPRCGQPIIVTEVEDRQPTIFHPVEQEIVCPQCDGFIATLSSYKRVFTYKAPVGDYADEIEDGAVAANYEDALAESG